MKAKLAATLWASCLHRALSLNYWLKHGSDAHCWIDAHASIGVGACISTITCMHKCIQPVDLALAKNHPWKSENESVVRDQALQLEGCDVEWTTTCEEIASTTSAACDKFKTCLQAMKALLQTKEKQDPKGWKTFQQQVNTLKLQRTRVQKELEEVQGALFSATQQLQAEIDDEAGKPSWLHPDGSWSVETGTHCLPIYTINHTVLTLCRIKCEAFHTPVSFRLLNRVRHASSGSAKWCSSTAS